MKRTRMFLFLTAGLLAMGLFSTQAKAQNFTIPAQPPSQQPNLPMAEKEWTFLVFLNGHNSLSSYTTMNLKDMEKTGSSDQLNIVVEWGQTSTNLTHRLLVQKSTDSSKVTSPIISSTADVDMGDYHELVNFVKWGTENFPAKHYFVAVWNHGSGWNLEQVSKNNLHVEDISYDDDSGHHISTEELGRAMAEIKQIIGRNVDIYGSDACLMQMAEVIGEMKDSVNYFVGSQDLEPGEGWPYAPFLQKWGQNPQMSPTDVAVLLSKEYLAGYSGGVYGRKSVTFAAVDVSKFDAFMNSAKQLAASLEASSAASLKTIKSAVSRVQGFYYGTGFKDYGDLIKNISALSIEKDDALINQAQSDLKALVLSTDNSSSYSKATGLSVWVPTSSSSDMPRYKGLVFDKTTGWSGFLDKMIQAQ